MWNVCGCGDVVEECECCVCGLCGKFVVGLVEYVG